MKKFDLAVLNTPEGRLRLLSSVMLAPVFIAVVCLGHASYSGLIMLLTGVGLYEWFKLVDPEVPDLDRYGMFGAHVFALLLAACGLIMFGFIVVVMATVAFYAHRSNETDAKPAFWFAFGLPYMAISGISLIYLRGLPDVGFQITLFLLAAVWGMDIGAYAVGRIVGGPKLAPAISPNKTWSGFCGGLVLAWLLCLIVMLVYGAQSIFSGMVVALLLGAVAQAGDLFKSFFKRRANVKDSGNLIPGHGGILDRVDGLVFSAVFFAFLNDIFGDHFIW